MSEITVHVQAHSVNGDSAGHISGDKFGFVHEAGLDVSALEGTLTERTRAADPAGKGIAVETATVDLDRDSDVSEEDSAKALLYTINRFSDERGDFTISDLSDGYKLMLDETVERISSFKSTLAKSEFDVVYQPIVHLSDRSIHHFEALVRLRDKSGGSPFQFITFAEEVGVIGEFDLAMAHRAITKINQAKKNGDILKVAVNLSGRSLESRLHRRSAQDAADVPRHPRPAHVRGHRIGQDHQSRGNQRRPTEPAPRRPSRLPRRLRRRRGGVSVSSRARGGLRQDRRRVRPRGPDHAQRQPFLRAMAGLCSEIGIQTVAEMVETEEEAQFLFEAKVQFGQGYLFGKPAQGITGIRESAATKAV